ncbi:hypothetical protein AAF712_005856 [Marasmius tenuissimus]|uniref:F-box domain-containing protein n=1 Tax=Marasmius tenuissimus TaxID=585030 RepID=A0ABR3A114_9AGAR
MKSPTCRMPVEILSSIFQFLSPTGGLVHRGTTPWWRFSHVCRHWRNVALNDPLLWSAPDYERPVLAMEMLRRSKDVPLRVLIIKWRDDEKNLDCPVTETLTEHVSRVSALEMYAGPRTGFSFDPLLKIDAPVPSLRSIHLACILPYMFPGSTPFEFALPEHILDAHSLDRLVIKGFLLSSYNFTHAALANLTSIHLSLFTDEGNNLKPGIEELLTLTQRVTNLEALSLEILRGTTSFVPGHVVPPASKTDAPVSLPRLSSLRLQGNLDCVHLVNYWTFPTSTRVEVVGKFATPAHSRPVDADFTSLSRLIPPSSSTSIVIEGDYRVWSHQNFWVTGVSVYYTDSPLTETPSIKFELDIEHSESMLRRLLKSLSPSQVGTLHFICTSSTPEPVYTDIIQDCFGSLGGIQRMSMRGVDPTFARLVLGRTVRRSGDSNVEAAVFPGIRAFELDCGQSLDGEGCMMELSETLRLRKQYGASFETLKLGGAPPDLVGLRELEDMVGQLVLS